MLTYYCIVKISDVTTGRAKGEPVWHLFGYEKMGYSEEETDFLVANLK